MSEPVECTCQSVHSSSTITVPFFFCHLWSKFYIRSITYEVFNFVMSKPKGAMDMTCTSLLELFFVCVVFLRLFLPITILLMSCITLCSKYHNAIDTSLLTISCKDSSLSSSENCFMGFQFSPGHLA